MSPKTKRCSGILCHITSLPSGSGIGSLGPEALAFLDFLVEANQSLWQVLPVGPVDVALGGSPYCAVSSFAGNELLVGLEGLPEMGLLEPRETGQEWTLPNEPIDWVLVSARKGAALDKAWKAFSGLPLGTALREEFENFRGRQRAWLDDYSSFQALKSSQGGKPWTEWPAALRMREPEALRRAAAALESEKGRVEFGQWLFFRQWEKLRFEAGKRRIALFGDLPIYVGLDSADVWCWQEGFDLGMDGRPVTVAGVPPDYFSETGQRWGNPTYRWAVHAKDGFSWWRARVGHALSLFDFIRLDHFRGLSAFWSIPAEDETAVRGRWVEAPGRALLEVLREDSPDLPIVAEDLGIITPDVTLLKERFGLPGMRVLQFGFSGNVGSNPHAPHNFPNGVVAYTGTHDNNTVRGWFEEDLEPYGQALLSRYVGHQVRPERVAKDLVRLALASPAAWAVSQLQDILGLDGRSRMNTPSKPHGNWTWRATIPTLECAREISAQVEIFGRGRIALDNVIN